MGISITAERAEIIAYSQPYLTLNQRLLLLEGEERFASWEEFRADEQLLLGAQGGTTDWQFAAEELGEARLIAYDSTPAGIQGLIAGEIAALLLDDAVGAYFAQQQPGQLRLLPDELAAGQDIGLVFPPGSALIAHHQRRPFGNPERWHPERHQREVAGHGKRLTSPRSSCRTSAAASSPSASKTPTRPSTRSTPIPAKRKAGITTCCAPFANC